MTFTAAEVEDGTGLSTALVFEQSAVAAAWLSHAARGLTGFSTATSADKDKALLKATNVVCDWIRDRIDGYPLTSGQALPYPRVGSTDRDGRTFDSDETPAVLLQAIRLMAEEEVVTGIDVVGSDSTIASRSAPGGTSVTFRAGAAAGSVAVRYPEAWRLAARLWDPNRRRMAA